jgi:hypothetical protein
MLNLRTYWLPVSLLAANAVLFVIGILVLDPIEIDVCKEAADGTRQQCDRSNFLNVVFFYFGTSLFTSAFWTAIATVAIAAFTYTLKKSTDRLWLAGERQVAIAKQAADAATLNAQVLFSSERPVIILQEPAAQLLPRGAGALWPDMEGVPHPRATTGFKNVGKTLAIVKEYRAEFFFGSREAIPPIPAFTYSKRRRVEMFIASENEREIPTVEFDRNLTEAEFAAFKENSTVFVLFGYVKYADFFGNLHTKGFGFVFMGSGKQGLLRLNSYNYSKSEPITDEYAT